jgi:hypothetical protein
MKFIVFYLDDHPQSSVLVVILQIGFSNDRHLLDIVGVTFGRIFVSAKPNQVVAFFAIKGRSLPIEKIESLKPTRERRQVDTDEKIATLEKCALAIQKIFTAFQQ